MRVITKKLEKYNQLAAHKFALGTAQFGMNYGIANKDGRPSEAEAKAMLDLCRSHHINLIDTAIAYGDSELCLGNCGVGEFQVVTKLPKLPEDRINIFSWVEEEIEASLGRLGISSVYGVLCHHPQDLIGQDGVHIFESLKKLKEKGLIKKIGISIYSPNNLGEILGRYAIDIVQAPLNLVDRRLIESGLLGQLNTRGVEVHVRSIFLQGLLLLSASKIPAQFSQWNCLWNIWQNWLLKERISPAEACIAYVLGIQGIDKIIVGADSCAHLLEIIQLGSKGSKLSFFPDISSTSESLINPSQWKLK